MSKEIADSLRQIAKDGFRIECYDNGILEEAADLIEKQKRRLDTYENPLLGLVPESCAGIVLEPLDAVKREYHAYTVKGSSEIVLICRAVVDGEGHVRHHRFVNLYSAQLHSIGVAHALANLISHPQPIELEP